MSINACTFVGNLTRDPELKALPTGTQVCEFSIAVNERVKQNNEWTDYANYLDIVVYGGQAENCAKFLSKGRQVAVAGRAKQQRWQNPQGENRSRVVFIATEVQFVGGKPQGQQGSDNGQGAWGGQSSDFGGAPAGQQPSMNDNWGAPPPQQTGPADDSDIPFRWRGHEDHRAHNHNPFA